MKKKQKTHNKSKKGKKEKTFSRLVVSNGISSRENPRKRKAMITNLNFLNPCFFQKDCVYHSPKRLLVEITSSVKDRELC